MGNRDKQISITTVTLCPGVQVVRQKALEYVSKCITNKNSETKSIVPEQFSEQRQHQRPTVTAVDVLLSKAKPLPLDNTKLN